MATLVSRKQYCTSNGIYCEDLELSSLTGGATESTAHLGPTATAVQRFSHYIKTQATSADPVFLTYAATDTTNNEVDYCFDTVPGGDVAGAVVVLHCEWLDQARQDGTSISTDNDD